jgi:hypothetical protein
LTIYEHLAFLAQKQGLTAIGLGFSTVFAKNPLKTKKND